MERLINREAPNDPVVAHLPSRRRWSSAATSRRGAHAGQRCTCCWPTALGTGLPRPQCPAGHGAFYRMTEWASHRRHAREINSKVRPRCRWIALTRLPPVAVNFRERYVTVWNGGNPGPLLIRPDGAVRLHFNRHHFPSAWWDDDEFDGTVDSHMVDPRDQPPALLRRADRAGRRRRARPSGRRPRRGAARPARRGAASHPTRIVGRMTGGSPPRDDVSTPLIDLADNPGPSHAAQGGRRRRCSPPATGAWGCVSARPTSSASTRCRCLGAIEHFEGCALHRAPLPGAVRALQQCPDHGLLRLPSSLKVGGEGLDAYLDERGPAPRPAGGRLPSSELTSARPSASRRPCSSAASDTGPGFDHQQQVQALCEPTTEEMLQWTRPGHPAAAPGLRGRSVTAGRATGWKSHRARRAGHRQPLPASRACLGGPGGASTGPFGGVDRASRLFRPRRYCFHVGTCPHRGAGGLRRRMSNV